MTFYHSLFRYAGITLLILIIWHVMLSGLINFQLEKNIQRHLLLTEKVLDILEYEKRQQKMVHSQANLHFIAILRHQNEEASLILKELGKATPEVIDLSGVKWQDKFVWVEGYTHSDLELINWIDNIRKSSVLDRPVITAMGDRNQLRYFQVRMGLK